MVYLLSVCAFGVMSVSFGFWEKYTEVLKNMNKILILFCGMLFKLALKSWISSKMNENFLLFLFFSIKNVVDHKDATVCGFNKELFMDSCAMYYMWSTVL